MYVCVSLCTCAYAATLAMCKCRFHTRNELITNRKKEKALMKHRYVLLPLASILAANQLTFCDAIFSTSW